MAGRQMDAVVQHIRQLAEGAKASSLTDQQLLQRFVQSKDEAAFASLVRRHGPMILSLCRRLLHHVQDAEDVFQATFLVLARKATAIRKQESVGSWLYGVAYRLALKTKTQTARCHKHPLNHRFAFADRWRNDKSSGEVDPLSEITWHEVCTALDEELARLPDRCRAPLVLCYLQGKTQDEAIQQLGWSKSSFRRRLEEGRTKLCLRLTRRGITLSAGLWAALLSDQLRALTQPGSPAADLMQATVKAAIPFAAGEIASAGISPQVTLMAKKALKAVFVTKLKWIAVLGVLTAGLGLAAHQAITGNQGNAEPKELLASLDEQLAQPKKEKQPLLDRYGDPLPPRALQRLGTVRFRHGQQIYSVAYSPDSKLIASGSLGSIRLWEANSGKPVAILSAYKRHVFSLMFSKDGRRLVSAGIDEMDPHPGSGKLILWDVADRRPIFTVNHNGWVRTTAISSDGRHIAMGCDDGTLTLLDGKSGKELHTLGQQGRFMQAVAFSPDGSMLAAVGDDNCIQFWDAATGQKLFRLPDAGRLRSLVFSPDGMLLASAHDTGNFPNDDSAIYLWNLTTKRKVQTLRPNQGTTFSLAFSADQELLASAGMRGLVVVWNVASGKELRKLHALDSWVQGIAFAPEGKTLIAGSSLGRIQVWDTKTGEERFVVDEHAAGLADIDLSSDGKTLATASADKMVRLWDLTTGRSRKIQCGTERGPYCVKFASDGKGIVTGGGDGLVIFWNLATGREERRLSSPDDNWHARAVYSPSGRILATSHVGTIRLWDTSTDKEMRQLKGHDGYVVDMAFSPDERLLASAAHSYGGAKDNKSHEDWSIRLWDVRQGTEIERIPQLYPDRLAFRPDGRVLIWHGSGPMHQRDLLTGEEWPGKEGETAFAFSRDGHWFASAMTGGKIHIREAATGQEVMHLEASPANVLKLLWAPDGKTLVSSQDDATVLIWDLAPPGWQAAPQQLSAQHLQQAWEDLKSDDSSGAYRAVWLLASSGESAINLLKNNLRPVAATAETERILRLVKDLDHEDFSRREMASRELEIIGAGGEIALVQGLTTNPSLEFRTRAQKLLQKIAAMKKAPSGDELRIGRALAVLERLGTPAAIEVLNSLAGGAPDARLTHEAKASLDRLARKSAVAP
jgi:RNA polymerase sigma factor (sigma-70 family)